MTDRPVIDFMKEIHGQHLEEFPTIVCLCGSGRFREAFEEAEFNETLAGKIVLTIGCNTKDVARTDELLQYKQMLDELHLRKIDLADEVLIINVGGYIGESTRRELNYAKAQGKLIRFVHSLKRTVIFPQRIQPHFYSVKRSHILRSRTNCDSILARKKLKGVNMELNERIKLRMDEKHWSLADLARETKIAKGYLWEILKGEAKRPSAQTLYTIAKALGTSVADLLGKENEAVHRRSTRMPDSLREFAEEENLLEKDVKMLASINFRGKQPKTKEDWAFLYQSVKRSVRG